MDVIIDVLKSFGNWQFAWLILSLEICQEFGRGLWLEGFLSHHHQPIKVVIVS